MVDEAVASPFRVDAATVDAVAEILQGRTQDVWFDPAAVAAAIIARLGEQHLAPAAKASEVIVASIERHTRYHRADAGMAFAILLDLHAAGMKVPAVARPPGGSE